MSRQEFKLQSELPRPMGFDMIASMKRLILITFSLSLSLSLMAFAADYKEVRFTKVCKRCGKISNEIQMYAYNSWTDTWQKSWRSDTNRPGCCEECYFELQPKIKFIEKPKTTGLFLGLGNHTNDRISSQWWNNGKYERQSTTRPIIDGPWHLGRLKR